MKRFALLAIILIFTVLSFAQDLQKALESYNKHYPAEKLYLHVDKEVYYPGETLWFKAYFYLNGFPSATSSHFHLQLFNLKGQLIEQKHYAIAGGSSAGSIDLPDSLSSGNYIIRAGTAIMLQHYPELMYSKPIFIGNTGGKLKNTIPGGKLQLAFYPESGQLIEGILTNVAFKATDEEGRPVVVAGTIKTPEGIEIPMRTYRNGLGRFLLRPKAGQVYTAEVTVNGKNENFPLPAVQPSGMNLHVQDEKGGKLFQLSRSDKEKEKLEVVHLVATLNNTLVYDNRISFDGYSSVKGHLLTDSLPSGILHFTVFNENMVPLAERLAFVNNGEFKVDGNLEIIEKNLQPRGKNILKLTIADVQPTSLSVSVSDASFDYPDRENIFSRLLLTSDLKGFVFNPAQYFMSNDDSTRQALDLLLMTQKWNRYQWKDVLTSQRGIDKTEAYWIEFTGQVTDAKDKKAINGGKLNIYLEAEDSTVKAFEMPVNAQGQFRLDSLFFAGKGIFYYEYRASNGKTKDVEVTVQQPEMDNRWSQVASSWLEQVKPPSLVASIPPAVPQPMKQAGEKPMEAVVLTSKQKRPADVVNETYATGIFQSMGKIILDNINQPYSNPSQDVVSYIEQTIRTVKLQGNRFVNMKNFSLRSGQNWEIGVFMNETPTTVANLRPIRMDEVALIKFYEAGFPGVSTSTPGGAIVVYLKTGGEKSKQQAAEKFFEVNGFSVSKVFPADVTSDYEGKDLRSTLYWNPSVFTSSESQFFEIRFFNNDLSRKLRVVVEGFDAAGRLIHLQKIIE